MTLVKSALKKGFAKKTDFSGTFEKQFFGYNFFWVHFLLRSNLINIFEISVKRWIVSYPLAIFEEKKFLSRRRDNEYGTFFITLRSKMQDNAQYFDKQVFYEQVLAFKSPFKILCHTSKLLHFVK